MVQSYLSYPFHANTHTHTSLPPHFSHPQPVSVTVTNDALSVVRIALPREARMAPAHHSPPPSSRPLHKTRVNGSAITPNPFSKRPPAERERGRDRGSWRERERRVQKRGLYTNGRGACLSVSRLSRNVVLGLAWVAAGQIFSDSSQIVSPPGWADALFALLPDGIYRLFRVD